MAKRETHKELAIDWKFARKSENFAWQLWVLKTVGKTTTSYLFYSWIIPTFAKKSGWQKPQICTAFSSKNKHGSQIKFELIRATFYGPEPSIKSYINHLLQGFALGEYPLEVGSAIPTEILNLNLEDIKNAQDGNYAVRPTVFLPIEHALIPWEFKPPPSPTGYGCFMGQVILLRKYVLIKFEWLELDTPDIKTCLQSIKDCLIEETGFDITNSSASRIGNIEWFSFPFADAYSKPLIKFDVEKTDVEGRTIKVVVGARPENVETRSLLIRCRVNNGEEVVLDEIVEIEWQRNEQEIKFLSNEPASDVLLNVWAKQSESKRSEILFESSSTLLRTITTNTSIVNASINAGSVNLLTDLQSNEQEKRMALAAFHRSSAGLPSMIGGYSSDPWVESNRSATSLMKQIFPKTSEGHFFLRGWDSQKKQSGQLSFVEWMLKLISLKHKNVLILIDPFFDEDGVEIFSLSRTSNAQYRILTCTQHRGKKNDTKTVSTVETKAASLIKAACRKALPLLQGINLEIYDLQSVGSGKNQLFHDRYLLVTDETGAAKKGFHLSNSIQGATRRQPLLITPIPSDIIENVAAYVKSLMSVENKKASDRKTKMALLFPFSSDDVTEVITKNPQRDKIENLLSRPHMTELLPIIFQSVDIINTNASQLRNFLEEEGLMKKGSDTILLFNLSDSRLEEIADALSNMTPYEFNKVWSAVGYLLADSSLHAPKSNYSVWQKLVDFFDEGVAQHLASYIKSYNNTDVLSYKYQDYNVFKFETFEEGLERVRQWSNNLQNAYFSEDWGLTFAIVASIDQFPILTLDLLDELLNQIVLRGWNQGDIYLRPKLKVLAIFANKLVSFGHRITLDKHRAFLCYKNFSFRAFSASILVDELLNNNDLDSKIPEETILMTLKQTLPDDEFRFTIAAVISDLQLKNIDDDVKERQQRLFASLIEDWRGDQKTIQRTVNVLSGRLFANHSLLINDNFFARLEHLGILDREFAFSFWQNIFLNKISPSKKKIIEDVNVDDKSFSINTDIELTNTLLKEYAKLNEGKKEEAANEWLLAIKPLWKHLEQPFARRSIYNTYDEACTRIYWVLFIIDVLKKDHTISDKGVELVNAHLSQYAWEIENLMHYIKHRGHQSVEKMQIAVE